MPNIKAKVKLYHIALKGLFDVGDEVMIEPILYEEDTIIQPEVTYFDKQEQVWKMRFSKVVAPKGSYKDFKVMGKDGNYYGGTSFDKVFGQIPLSEMFEKI